MRYFEDKNFVYFAMYISMYILMYYGGKEISKRQKWSELLWLLPIFAYGLNAGLRYARGVDYILYMTDFENFANGTYPGEEPLFYFICYFFYNILHLPWPFLALALSFFLILTGCVFLKRHKVVLRYALPLFAYYSVLSENLVRWFFAFSFVLLGIYFYDKSKEFRSLVISFVFFLCGVLVHYGIITVLIPVIIIHPFKRPILNPHMALISMLTIYCLIDPSILGEYTSFFKFFNINGRFDAYIYDTEKYSEVANNYGLSITNLILYIIFIYKGASIVRKKRELVYLYNISLLGVVLSPVMCSTEILMRINYCLTFFVFLFFAYTMKYDFEDSSKGLSWSLLVLLILIKDLVFTAFGHPGKELLYLWDIGFNIT